MLVMFSVPCSPPEAALFVCTYRMKMSVDHCSLTCCSKMVESAPSGR